MTYSRTGLESVAVTEQRQPCLESEFGFHLRHLQLHGEHSAAFLYLPLLGCSEDVSYLCGMARHLHPHATSNRFPRLIACWMVFSAR